MATHSKKFYVDKLKAINVDTEKKSKAQLINECEQFNLLEKDETPIDETPIDEIIDDESEAIEQALINARDRSYIENNSVVEESEVLIKRERKKRAKKDSKPDSFRLEGYLLLMLVDTAFPFSLAFINNMMSKVIKVEATELALTDKQMQKLEPLADQAADFLTININPVTGFFITTSLMYASNLMSLRSFKSSQLPKQVSNERRK